MFTGGDGGSRVRSAKELAAHILKAKSKTGPKQTVVSPAKKGDPTKQDFVKKKSKKKMVKKKK